MPRLFKAGIIGYRNHAARLIGLLEGMEGVQVEVIYHPAKALGLPNSTTQFDDLLTCDAVFIASPNDTHFDYLQRLAGFTGYVFCEKPPVTHRGDLSRMRELCDPGRTYFNFNMRFSAFGLLARRCLDEGKLGQILFADAIAAHGLAFKADYANSWRADRQAHRLGIVETVTIHHIDLVISLLGKPSAIAAAGGVRSGCGTAFDTARVTLSFASGATASLAATYAGPARNVLTLMGTDGVVEMIDDSVAFKGPRDHFDSRGMFSPPPVIEAVTVPPCGPYMHSLSQSVAFFVEHARAVRPIPRKWFDDSIATMECLFAIEDAF